MTSVGRAAAAAADDDAPLHQSCVPALTRSWPSSPLSALSSSRQVTARLYSSLQHSREQEVKGHAARQVSFALSSPDLTAVRTTAATPPLLSHRLEDLSLDSTSSSHDVIGSGVEGVESEADGEMDLHLQSSLSRSAQLTSGRKHIEEMENVRTHLQFILRNTPTSADRHDFLAPASQHFLDDSHESDATSHLLSAGLSVGGVEQLFPRYSRLHADSSGAASELQVLRESLDRERERRKVCEQQVVSLHSKVLQFQQQLTLAVAADRKKDIMIEQLDKTLVKVVEGWKKHDQERNEEMKHLQVEKEMAERTCNTHKQALSRVEQNLSQVEEKLNQEQKHKQELQKTNKHLEQEARELRLRVEELQQEEQKLRRDADRLREQLHKLQTESHDTRTHAQQLQQQLTHATQQLHTHTVKQEVAAREEAESRTRQIQEELEQIRRERDALRVDRALEQTRFEAQKSQMEAEFRLSLERQINERLTAIQEENATHNAQLRQQHRKQLLDLSARHERELAAQLDQFRTQLQEKDDKLQHLTHSYQHKYSSKLSEMQEELVSMAASKRKLEAQREELVSRLQGMMRSHWAEALRLLTNQEQMESFLSPVAQWEASKTSSSPPKRDTHASAPQAVVLHLSREKERGMRSEEQETRAQSETSSHSEFGLLNCSTSFCPLEPVLEHTDMTALSDCSGLWVRPAFSENETMKERNEETREVQMKQILNLNHSQCESNQIRVMQKQNHAPTDTRTNHSSSADSGRGRVGASGVWYSSDSEKVPPIRDEAPPNRMRVSSLNEDNRQNELQYYVSKLLERSPGDPVDEAIKELKHEPERHMSEPRSTLEQKPDQRDKPEACVSSRSVPSRRSASRRGGPQRVWR
ncbi:centrobin isoform X3 [Sinocyclocheilus rhinocerous]|uniref:centrobin isoform X3 n=1 Tax=Sinocyclocheilus rhinocerous TaxID=307959 RepID=UPI0007BAA6B1|nr:PREDICTED: centrobin isoform X3 [Sinocyclocheilus rhinocerous]